MLKEEHDIGKFDPPPFGHFGGDKCGHGIVSCATARSNEEGEGRLRAQAGRQTTSKGDSEVSSI